MSGLWGYETCWRYKWHDLHGLGGRGIIGSRLGGFFYDVYHNYRNAFYAAALAAILALVFEFLAKQPTNSSETIDESSAVTLWDGEPTGV